MTQVKSKDTAARAELQELERRFSLGGCRVDATSIDERRHKITFPDGSRAGFMAHLNKRKKAMRDWLRKWGKELKKHGYQVHVTHDELLPQFLIEEIQPNDDDDAAAQLEKEKYKKFFDPKSARSKRLGKKPEE